MIHQLFIISRHTFRQSIRQPVFVVLILLSGLALVLNPALAAYSLGDDNKLMIDMGFSTLFVAGLLMAAFTATGVLSQELENKTASTVASKPVARPVFVIGKYIGVSAAIALAYWGLCVVYLLTVRHRVLETATSQFDGPVWLFGSIAAMVAMLGATAVNYLYNRPFTSSFVISLSALMTLAWAMVLMIDKQWQFQAPTADLQPQIMIGLLLIFLAVLVLTALAIAASTRLGQMMTLLVCVIGFGVGLLNDFIFGGLAKQYAIAKPLYLALPNFQLFWPADAISQGQGFTAVYVGLVSGYAVLYVTALVAMAVGLFENRQIG